MTDYSIPEIVKKLEEEVGQIEFLKLNEEKFQFKWWVPIYSYKPNGDLLLLDKIKITFRYKINRDHESERFKLKLYSLNHKTYIKVSTHYKIKIKNINILSYSLARTYTDYHMDKVISGFVFTDTKWVRDFRLKKILKG